MSNLCSGSSKVQAVDKGISLKSSLNLSVSNHLINLHRVWYLGVNYYGITRGIMITY